MIEGHEFLYEFGPFTLHERERVLRREGLPVALAPKALDTLLSLIRNSNRLVEKEQLMAEVWPATFVEEANLTQNIFILRKVLDDGNDGSSYIETLPRRGYRFIAPVRKILDLETGKDSDGQDVSAPGERVYRFLAILPFVNASGDEKMDYLSDGITESIINGLSQLPQLRVMSRNAVFRYKGREVDAQRIGRELGVDAVLVGRVHLLGGRLLISTELVDVVNGWQLWGENYDRGTKAILEVQDEIARQISATLKIKLTGDDEQRLTKRYTESAEAYQAYLQGRYHWSNFTRDGLEQATIFFREAINLDPNYALAYAGIVDCYLRLATNYIPPPDTQSRTTASGEAESEETQQGEALEPVKTRYKWDWTGVERELKRATELKSSYPAAHQWHAAYLFSLNLFREALGRESASKASHLREPLIARGLAEQIRSATPTPTEEVQVFCTIAREQIESGNYEGGYRVMQHLWTMGEWPKLKDLTSYSAGDLLFTAGSLTGWMASARQMPAGQKHAEALLNGSIGIFEQLGLSARSAEAQIELAYCYYREGLFDLARVTMRAALKRLTENDPELRSLGLIRTAIVERQAGRLKDSLSILHEGLDIVESVGPRVSGRYYQELATTLKDLGNSEGLPDYFTQSAQYYRKALAEFEAVGNHRYSAVVENNHGYLLLSLGKLQEGETHLCRARALFISLGDALCSAQVDETLAQFHIAAERYELANEAISRAVIALELSGQEAVLIEALTTQGLVLSRLGQVRESKLVLYKGSQLAERCGDSEGAGKALLVIVEELCNTLDRSERDELSRRLIKLLAQSQQAKTLKRLTNGLRVLEGLNTN